MLDRRQFIGVAGAAALGLGLAACDAGGSGSGTGAKESTARRVATVCDGPINDGGWCASCYQAMVEAADELGWESAYAENVAQADWGTSFQNYIEQGFDLIFVQGEEYQDVVVQLAKEYPDAHFALLQGTTETDNIESLAPNDTQIGQLAGALAGLITKTNSVGFIGGVELSSTQTKVAQFEAALTTANPEARLTVVYAGSYTDAAKGKEIAQAMVSEQDVDVVYGDASIVDTGAREALSGYDDRYNIGQPADLGSVSDPLIACSIVTDNKSMLVQSMKNVEDGSFGNKTIVGGLDNGGVYHGTFSDVIVSSEVQQEFETIAKKIESGVYVS